MTESCDICQVDETEKKLVSLSSYRYRCEICITLFNKYKEMKFFQVGEMLYGFCNGYFGRDSYDKKRIEAVGADWIVCRDEYDDAIFASFPKERLESDKFWEDVTQWRIKPHSSS